MLFSSWPSFVRQVWPSVSVWNSSWTSMATARSVTRRTHIYKGSSMNSSNSWLRMTDARVSSKTWSTSLISSSRSVTSLSSASVHTIAPTPTISRLTEIQDSVTTTRSDTMWEPTSSIGTTLSTLSLCAPTFSSANIVLGGILALHMRLVSPLIMSQTEPIPLSFLAQM